MKRVALVALAIVVLGGASACGALRRTSNPPPPSTQGGDSKTREEAFRAAVKNLAKKTGAPARDIAGVSQEDVTWSDSCLGCTATGESCAQVLTPGYKIILRVRDATYEYHTNRGDRARLCGQSMVSPAPNPTPY